jgi:hypothetical protein
MELAKGRIVAALVVGLLTAAGMDAAQATEPAPALKTMKPMAGVSFDIGTKHAVSYFLSSDGACQLTLMVADAFNGNDVPKSKTTRFDVGIDGGESARLEVAEGKALEFTCQAGAHAMSIKALDQVAVYPPRSN